MYFFIPNKRKERETKYMLTFKNILNLKYTIEQPIMMKIYFNSQ